MVEILLAWLAKSGTFFLNGKEEKVRNGLSMGRLRMARKNIYCDLKNCTVFFNNMSARDYQNILNNHCFVNI